MLQTCSAAGINSWRGVTDMPAVLDRALVPEPIDIGDEELAEISTILGVGCGFSMSAYKDKCMRRRIAIRMRSVGCSDPVEYCSLLRRNEREMEQLQKVLTIHVSQFFRNPGTFERLKGQVLPRLFDRKRQAGHPGVTIWSMGCAAGEEPYSLAILLREHFADELARFTVTILATDIDRSTLEAAARGEYVEERLKEVPADIRSRYFREEGNRCVLSPGITGMVTLCHGDITRTDEYRSCDLVLCRNTLIYFTRPQQEQILGGVAAVLPSGGILVLGKSEALVGESRRHFSTDCPVERIYSRR